MLRSAVISMHSRPFDADIPLRNTISSIAVFDPDLISSRSSHRVLWLLVTQSLAWCRSSHCEKMPMVQFVGIPNFAQFAETRLTLRLQYKLTNEYFIGNCDRRAYLSRLSSSIASVVDSTLQSDCPSHHPAANATATTVYTPHPSPSADCSDANSHSSAP